MYNRTPIEYAWWLHPAQELHHFSKGRMRADLLLWQRQMGWNEMGFNLHPSTEAKKKKKKRKEEEEKKGPVTFIMSVQAQAWRSEPNIL